MAYPDRVEVVLNCVPEIDFNIELYAECVKRCRKHLTKISEQTHMVFKGVTFADRRQRFNNRVEKYVI
jgi:hypothetical protein